MEKPQTRIDGVTEDLHGVNVVDPYRWLERAEDADVQSWITKQNEYALSRLKNKQFESFSEELIRTSKVTNFSNPLPCRGRYFYTERKPNEDQSVLYVCKGLEGEPTELFNPNGKREGNTVAIDYWVPSRSGNLLVFGISEGGNEMATLYVKNVETGELLPDVITRCRYSSVAWMPDDSGFFYTRNAAPSSIPTGEEHLHQRLYFHRLGVDPDQDEMVFGEGRPKDDMITLRISLDGRYLGIQVAQAWAHNDIYIYDTTTKKVRPLVTDIRSRFTLSFMFDKVVLDTNYKANNYRLLSASFDDLYKPIDEWKELVPEREHVLQSMHITKNKMLIEYLVNACSEVVIFDHNGEEKGTIPLPAYSSLAGISSRSEEEEFFYGVESFTFPKITYRFDLPTGECVLYKKTESPIIHDDYQVTQEWFVSKDGTRAPMFILSKKNRPSDTISPTVLYGYGGFNKSVHPYFMRMWVPWFEQGGTFAVANIRGGGEFGERWHLEAVKENKQKSYDDFTAAAEYLIEKKYTDRGHLGIMGASNGGLLVSAVAVQRPDLFKAVCSRVPLTDMIRFPYFGIAMRWTHEYGDPRVLVEMKNILKWSPYHNVKEDVEYPAFFFITANKDTRVDPLHARKMSGLLQNTNQKNPVFIFTEMEAGHGPGKPIAKIVESNALMLSFFTQQLK